MRPVTYWIGQFLLAAGTMFLLLAAVDLMRGDSLAATWPATLGWSAAAAALWCGCSGGDLCRLALAPGQPRDRLRCLQG
jgi:hypothetical protein